MLCRLARGKRQETGIAVKLSISNVQETLYFSNQDTLGHINALRRGAQREDAYLIYAPLHPRQINHSGLFIGVLPLLLRD